MNLFTLSLQQKMPEYQIPASDDMKHSKYPCIRT